jgi:cysteine desulfurase
LSKVEVMTSSALLPTERLANTTSLTVPGVEAEALLLLLDQAGVCASAGSACLADSD